LEREVQGGAILCRRLLLGVCLTAQEVGGAVRKVCLLRGKTGVAERVWCRKRGGVGSVVN